MSISFCRSMVTHGRISIVALCVSVLLGGSLISAAGNGQPRATAEVTSPTCTQPSLIVDMKHSKMTAHLSGVTLREYKFAVGGDSGLTAELFKNLSERQADTQTVQNVYLISAAETITQLEMKILVEETGLDAGKVQRYVPGVMVIVTSGGLRIQVETDCSGSRTFAIEQIKDVFRRIWHEIFRHDSIRIHMSADNAMSLYGVAHPGVTLTFLP